jgi:TrmH family RNA methyltransferase
LKLLTLARDLRRRRARERQRLFVAEGVRSVHELLASPIRVRGALVVSQTDDNLHTAALFDALRARDIVTEHVTPAEFASAADTDTPQGVLAIAEVPDWSLASLPTVEGFRVLVLDGVQDPGNVGTMLRTAAALGAVATVALPGTVDLWNAKVVRSAMGAHFRHPALSCTSNELLAFLAERDAALWGADAAGESIDEVARSGPAPSRMALAVGNEGAGLSTLVRERADRVVAVPIAAAAVESLNVAAAAAILLYQLRQ